MKSFYRTIKEEFGNRYVRCSCIPDESTELIFREFLAEKPIKHALEIGTWFGISALCMACYAEKVTTIDCLNKIEASTLWDSFGMTDRITKHVIRSEKEKAEIIDHLDFDFVFIDGGHRYDSVKLDFALTEKCGRVLFHDYYEHTDNIPGIDFEEDIKKGKDPSTFEEVKRFVDELPKDEVVSKKPFALWAKKQQ
jgi:hypothetical protein